MNSLPQIRWKQSGTKKSTFDKEEATFFDDYMDTYGTKFSDKEWTTAKYSMRGRFEIEIKSALCFVGRW